MYAIRSYYEHDLSLGYSFECSVGMTPDQATQLYQEIVQMLGEKINTFLV